MLEAVRNSGSVLQSPGMSNQWFAVHLACPWHVNVLFKAIESNTHTQKHFQQTCLCLRWAPPQLKEDLQVALAAVASNPAATKLLAYTAWESLSILDLKVDGLRPNCDDLQPNCDGLQPSSFLLLVVMASNLIQLVASCS